MNTFAFALKNLRNLIEKKQPAFVEAQGVIALAEENLEQVQGGHGDCGNNWGGDCGGNWGGSSWSSSSWNSSSHHHHSHSHHHRGC